MSKSEKTESKTEAAAKESEDVKDDLPTKAPNAGTDALEQAAIYAAIIAPITLTFDDGSTTTIPPDPRLRVLDDDQLAEWDTLQFEKKSYDRGPDVVTVIEEQEIKDQHGNVLTTLPATTRTDPGPLLFPFQRDGELLTPPWEVREILAALGREKYDLLRSKTIDGEKVGVKHVYGAWRDADTRLRGRQAEDSKSAGGAVDLAPVPEADS